MLLNILQSMRPRQWTKNLFVLVAVFFDRQLFIPHSIFRSICGFVIFCLVSGAVYILNDLKDIESDRRHPIKKNRPIAAGKLAVPTAVTAMIMLLLIGFSTACLLSPSFFYILGIYFVTNLAYSYKLKYIPLLDVFILASGFVLRVVAGVSLIHIERFSPWMYVVTTLLALYLGFGKRRAELVQIDQQKLHTRSTLAGYSIPFLDQLITIVSSCTILTYSFYTFSAPNLPTNHSMMLSIPFVLYGIFRYLYLIQVKGEGGAPEDLLLKDRPLQITILLYGITVLLIFYIN